MFVKAKLTPDWRKGMGEGAGNCGQKLKFRLSTGWFLGVFPQWRRACHLLAFLISVARALSPCHSIKNESPGAANAFQHFLISQLGLILA
jgi:hypothetical protein